MQEMKEYTQYADFKQAFDREYRNQTEGYIRMGYLLKVARDTDILRASGYKSIAEFAWNEYKIRDDAVSRMIDVNDRFSEDGYSDRLDEKYSGYGASLLAEMITMSDAVIDALPPGTTREVIREVKKEIRDESKVTDLEVLIEGQDGQQADLESNLARMLHQYYRENSREYPGMHKAMTEETVDREAAVQILAPNGVCVKFARVRGVGKFMLSIKGRDQDLELLNVRENQTEAYTWEAALRVLCGLCPTPKTRTSWEAVYGEPYPEDKKEFAPAQEKKAEPVKEAEEKPEARTEPRSEDGTAAGRAEQRDEETEPQEPETGADQESGEVIEETEAQESTIEPAKIEEKEDPEPEETETDTEEQDIDFETEIPEASEAQESQVDTKGEPVQQGIESYPDTLPESYIKCHDGSEVTENEEHRRWKEAAEWSERLSNTFEIGEWPIEPKVLEEMETTAENLLNAIRALREASK